MEELKAAKAEKTGRVLFDIKDVSGWIGMSYRSIHRAVRQGRIKSVRCGGSVKIPQQEVERLLEKGF